MSSLNQYPLIEPATAERTYQDSAEILRTYVTAQCPTCGRFTLWDTGWMQPLSTPNRLHVCLNCDDMVRISCERGYPRNATV